MMDDRQSDCRCRVCEHARGHLAELRFPEDVLQVIDHIQRGWTVLGAVDELTLLGLVALHKDRDAA